jgi:hypothetical protein
MLPTSAHISSVSAKAKGLPDSQTCLQNASLNLVYPSLQVCAKSAGCAVDACSNIDDRSLASLYVDCIGLCNANVTSLEAYQNLNCLQVSNAACLEGYIKVEIKETNKARKERMKRKGKRWMALFLCAPIASFIQRTSCTNTNVAVPSWSTVSLPYWKSFPFTDQGAMQAFCGSAEALPLGAFEYLAAYICLPNVLHPMLARAALFLL